MNFRLYVTMALVAALHAGAIVSVMFVQGCRSPFHRVDAPFELDSAPGAQAPMPPLDAALASTPSAAFQPTYTPPPPEHKPAPATPAAASTYVVQRGDTLGAIAKRHGVSVADLVSANNIVNPNMVRIGQKLKIPEGGAAVATQKSVAPAATTKAVAGEGSYVVEAGDNLSKIAARFGVTVAALREANHLEGDKIIVGRTLIIPTGARSPALPAPAPRQEMPAPDAFPVEIDPEASFGAEPAASLAQEPEKAVPPSAVFATESAQPVASAAYMTHVVEEGTTLAGIASLYLISVEELARVNGLKEDAVLTPGQRLKVP